MDSLRHRHAAPARLALDGALIGSLLLLWLTGEATVWLHLAYVMAALSAFVRPGARSTLIRATVVSVLGGGELLRLHAAGSLPADDLLQIPLLTIVAYSFAVFAAQRASVEQQLIAERTKLTSIVDRLPLATIVFDEDARVVLWNRAAERLFGWRADEVVGESNPIVPVGQRDASDDLFRRIQRGETLQGVDVARRARDGSTLDLALYSAPLNRTHGGAMVLYANVADQRHAQRELDAAQRRYRELVESLPLVTYIDEVNDEATNVYTSPQMVDLLGWSMAEWLHDGQTFEELLHPDDHDRVMAEIKHSNATRDPFCSEYRLRHRDGHHVWVRDHSSIVDAPDAQPYARGFLLDITDQKRLESQLLQSQKMDALGQFAGGIAHDFNNLLTGIGGYADLASAAAAGDPTLARYLDGIRTASADAANLTARLLTFSRRQVPELSVIDVNEMVASAADFLERLVRADVRIDVVLGDDVPAVDGDLTQLRQVVLNLALNARDAMPDGGTLTIATSRAADAVVIHVTDTGHGMDEATRSRAFEPFFTTKAAGEGTGLGLAVVYGVVDGLGGSLDLESEPGAGTTVEVTLPASTAPAPTRPGASETEHERHAARILVAEDRAVVRELAREVLTAAGFEVAVASSGREAIELVGEAPAFDLLLSDVVMPEMSGPELAARLRAEQPGLSVLYMSGYTDDVLAASELQNDATSFIRKPFTNAQLVNAVQGGLSQPCAPAAAG